MQFRRAKLEDKNRILEICSTVWDGTDYMPNIVDSWIADDAGEFTVMEEDGVVMGLGKMTMIGPKIGWLEGLRVAPEARSKGFAKQITRYYVTKGEELELDQLELSTYYENGASIHVTESNGFNRVAEFWYGDQEIKPGLSVDGEVIQVTVDSENYEEIVQMILDAPEQKTQRDYLGYGWLFKRMTKDLISREIMAGHVYYLQKNDGILGVILIYPDYLKDKVLYIPLITGTDAGIVNLLNWAHTKAKELEFDLVAAMVPNEEHLKSLYLANGFNNWEDRKEVNVYVFQLNLNKEVTRDAT